MAAPTGVVSVNGFTVIPVRFNEKSKEGHQLFVKEHNIQEASETRPSGKTLFIANIPPYIDQPCLERLFSDCGKVMKVSFQKNPSTGEDGDEDISKFFPTTKKHKGFKVAYVVFKSASSVHKAKQICYEPPRILSTAEDPLTVGMKKWAEDYSQQYPDPDELQTEINTYMAEYDRKQKEEAAQAKEQEGVPDEDGWITVTRHSRNKGAKRTEAQDTCLKTKQKEKAKEKELLNFYAFQIRESKRDHINKLRQKFEEDKQKIASMKAARKFRPY